MRVRLKWQRLVELLSQSRISQNHWAIKLKLSRGHLSEILSGKHPYVSPKTREKLLDGLGVPFDDLFEVEAGDAWTHESSADFQSRISDRYLIDHELGQGGMGTVYLARDVKLGRQVAIKVVSPEIVSGVGTAQFLKEIRYASRLTHPHVLTLLDADEAAGYPYYVMPYVREGSLRAHLDRVGRMSVEEAGRLVEGVGAALEHAHENRIIHCDVKPANVLLAGRHAYLADFGISRAIHAEARAWRRRGEIDSSAGTPAYVSPEQATGEDLDGRADVYSLGCVVYEMLTGRPPFEGGTTMEVVSKRFSTMVPNLKDAVPEVSLEMARVVERAMSLDPGHRPTTATEFADEFRHAAETPRPLEAVGLAWSRAASRMRRVIGRGPRPALRPTHHRHRTWRLDHVIADLRFALRALRKRPGFTTVALLTLALGLGANTAIFSIINSVFFREPGVADIDGLVELSRLDRDGDYSFVSERDVEALRAGTSDVFAGLSSHKPFTGYVGGVDGAGDIVLAELVDDDFLAVLGVTPILGRAFLPEENMTPGTHAVVLLAHGYWTNNLGADPGIVGRDLRLNGRPYRVIGVTPPAFRGILGAIDFDLWVPMMMEDHLYPSGPDNNNRGVTARLRPGVSVSQANAALATLSQRVAEDRGWSSQFWEFGATRYDDIVIHPNLDGPITAMAVLLLALVGLVLLIACTNLASFLLARAHDRRKEIAIRLALGASRVGLIRQLLTESLVLGALGGTLGVLIAVWVVQTLVRMRPPLPIPVNFHVDLDLRVLAFTGFISILAGILFGLAPALQATRPNLARTLRDEVGAVFGRARFSLRSVLVAAQMALSLLLLVTAGLFIRSLRAATQVDVGFATTPGAMLTIDVRGSGYRPDQYHDLYTRVQRRVEGIPGVTDVAVADRLPLEFGTHRVATHIPGLEGGSETGWSWVDFSVVSPAYFEVVGIPLIEGRAFDASDRNGQPVAIVSEAASRRFWAGESPLGRTVRLLRSDTVDARIVGVAADAKVRSLNEPPLSYLYLPIEQSPTDNLEILVRGSLPPAQLAGELRRAVLEIDPNLFVVQTRTMAEHLGTHYYLPRMGAALISLSAALALALSCVGLYGSVSYAVSSRRREMGIRISLGAKAADVVRLMVRGGMVIVVVGGVVGLALAAAVARVLQRFLVGVSATDPITFVLVPLVLLGVALIAAYLPARKASRVSPMETLRAG